MVGVAVVNLGLQARHAAALQQALAWVPTIVEPLGIVVSGSIVRGNPGPASDLDIVVLHAGSWRRRVQRWFNGTPVEVFCNSQEWIQHSILDEAARGRPVMAHMLATGQVALDTQDRRMAALVAIARDVMSCGPCLSAAALLRDRYAAACQVEDALDLCGSDAPDTRRLQALAVEAVINHAYLSHNRFLPRPKERLSMLSEIDPALAPLISRALSEAPNDAAEALRAAAERVLGSAGFFEWDSGEDWSHPPAQP